MNNKPIIKGISVKDILDKNDIEKIHLLIESFTKEIAKSYFNMSENADTKNEELVYQEIGINYAKFSLWLNKMIKDYFDPANFMSKN